MENLNLNRIFIGAVVTGIGLIVYGLYCILNGGYESLATFFRMKREGFDNEDGKYMESLREYARGLSGDGYDRAAVQTVLLAYGLTMGDTRKLTRGLNV